MTVSAMETSSTSRDSLNFNLEDDEDDENSDDGLQIVLDTPKSKKRCSKELEEKEKEFIKAVEHNLEGLEEKAAKANLKVTLVKNILKHVVTNEQVLALVRHAENPDENVEPVVYEPKCTRAKTKQLLADNIQQKLVPWEPTQQESSEVSRLINEELQEETDDDEYNPNEDEEDANATADELNTTVNSNEEEEDEDGEEEEVEEEEEEDEEAEESETTKIEPNIALRTRSKLCLNDTPLEEIETSFMPPDITTDMYDMDCDDDDWRDFLSTFTKPLAEVARAAEDEDHDPEYNIMADEEIEKVDKEELRADRAVTVTRKELTNLMAELFEYTDIYNTNKSKENDQIHEHNPNLNTSNPLLDDSLNMQNNIIKEESDENMPIKKGQLLLLGQQIRQHIQILTQIFLLTYQHPEYGEHALKMKEYLVEIKEHAKNDTASVFNVCNLSPALALIQEWENLWASNSEESLETKIHIEKVIVESKQAKSAGAEYIPTFPKKLMEIVSKSDAFLYPSLLPRIPFKSSVVTRTKYYYFTASEDHLIAILMDIFQLESKAGKRMNLPSVCHSICSKYMPSVAPQKLEYHIRRRSREIGDNPIKYFHTNWKAPPTVHYVTPEELLRPPYKADPQLLPYLWKQFMYPTEKVEKPSFSDESNNNVLVLQPTPVFVALPSPVCAKKRRTSLSPRPIFAKPNCTPVHDKKTPDWKLPRRTARNKNFVNVSVDSQYSFSIPISYQIVDDMLPDMPSLGSTPLKKQSGDLQQSEVSGNEDQPVVNRDTELSFQNITQSGDKYYKPEKVRRNFEGLTEFLVEKDESGKIINSTASAIGKDNPDEINDLMVASSTVKTAKKEPSGAEKKRLKLKREFMSNLSMATPDDDAIKQQKEENFAAAFYEKLKTTLIKEDYEKIMSILGTFDQKNDQFKDLYRDIESVLEPKYQELSDEFLLFLSTFQAHHVGKLMQHFMMKDLASFMKNLQNYFKEQPFHLKKIVKALTELSENSEVNLEDIKNTVLPLLKGNAALTDLFLQIFPSERPPKLLTERSCEVVDIRTELLRPPNGEIYETISIPDTEDPYGGSNCVCSCHNVENSQYKSRAHHCNKCGLKFIQGKMFIQTGKALRPAVVSFRTNPDKDHTERLTGKAGKFSDSSPNKTTSTSPKESAHLHDDIRQSNESEEDYDKSKTKKKHKKTQVNKTSKDHSSKSKTPKNTTPRKPRIRKSSKKTSETEEKSSLNSVQQKRPAEEPLEFDLDGPAELVEMKLSSDHSGESESELFESSQDNITNTETDDESSVEIQPWSREEDKIILSAFQETSNKEQTFQKISKLLPTRQAADVKNRFHKLMTLLEEMATKKV